MAAQIQARGVAAVGGAVAIQPGRGARHVLRVRRVLDGYGQLDVEKRKEAVGSLAKLIQHGHDALLRLIVEEPSDDVKWVIVERDARKASRVKICGSVSALSVA